MNGKGTDTTENPQSGNFPGDMGDSPALAKLQAGTPNPVNPNTVAEPQAQVPSIQRDGIDLFGQMDRALEPGLFDGDTPVPNVQSSNDLADSQPQQIQPNQPQDILTTQPNLDTQMRQPIVDPSVNGVPDPNIQTGQPGQQDIVQRYSESSREAKRLVAENKELQEQLKSIAPVMPLVMKLKESEGLRNIVKGYYNTGGKMPTDLKKQLNLPEDFVFDGTEAFDNPDSDSAKLMASTIDMYTFSRANQMKDEMMRDMAIEKQKTLREVELTDFRKKHNIDDSKMAEINDFMKTFRPSYDDVIYLMTRGSREKNVAQHAQQDVLNQMRNVREMPTSLSGQTTQPVDINDENARFNMFFGDNEQDDGVFGNKDT